MEASLVSRVHSGADSVFETGKVVAKIVKDSVTQACFVQVVGDKLLLETFRGAHTHKLREIFKTEVEVERDELRDLSELFDKAVTGSSLFEERWKSDADKALAGNPFTGYAIVLKSSQKIVGRFAMEPGVEAGDAVCSLVMAREFLNQGYGKEATALAAGLGVALVQERCHIKTGAMSPLIDIRRFTAVVSSQDDARATWIRKIGWSKLSVLNSDNSLYGIAIEKLRDQISPILNVDTRIVEDRTTPNVLVPLCAPSGTSIQKTR